MIRPLRRAHARVIGLWWMVPFVIAAAMWMRAQS